MPTSSQLCTEHYLKISYSVKSCELVATKYVTIFLKKWALIDLVLVEKAYCLGRHYPPRFLPVVISVSVSGSNGTVNHWPIIPPNHTLNRYVHLQTAMAKNPTSLFSD